MWHIRARQVVLATGAHERPLVFDNNDRPGIMLASAVRTYLNRYAVPPAARPWSSPPTTAPTTLAADLPRAGVEVGAVVTPGRGLAARGAAASERGSGC